MVPVSGRVRIQPGRGDPGDGLAAQGHIAKFHGKAHLDPSCGGRGKDGLGTAAHAGTAAPIRQFQATRHREDAGYTARLSALGAVKDGRAHLCLQHQPLSLPVLRHPPHREIGVQNVIDGLSALHHLPQSGRFDAAVDEMLHGMGAALRLQQIGGTVQITQDRHAALGPQDGLGQQFQRNMDDSSIFPRLQTALDLGGHNLQGTVGLFPAARDLHDLRERKLKETVADLMVHTAIEDLKIHISLKDQFIPDHLGLGAYHRHTLLEQLRSLGLTTRQGHLIGKLEGLFLYAHHAVGMAGLTELLHPGLALGVYAGAHRLFQRSVPLQLHGDPHPDQYLARIERTGLRPLNPAQRDETAPVVQPGPVHAAAEGDGDIQPADPLFSVRQVQHTCPDGTGDGRMPLRCLPAFQFHPALGIQDTQNIRAGIRYDHLHGLFLKQRGVQNCLIAAQLSPL